MVNLQFWSPVQHYNTESDQFILWACTLHTVLICSNLHFDHASHRHVPRVVANRRFKGVTNCTNWAPNRALNKVSMSRSSGWLRFQSPFRMEKGPFLHVKFVIKNDLFSLQWLLKKGAAKRSTQNAIEKGFNRIVWKNVDLNPTTDIIVQGYGGLSKNQLLQGRVLLATSIHLPIHRCNLASILELPRHHMFRYLRASGRARIWSSQSAMPSIPQLPMSRTESPRKAEMMMGFFSYTKKFIIWCFLLPLKNGGGFIHMMILRPQAQRPLVQSHDVGSSGQVPQHD